MHYLTFSAASGRKRMVFELVFPEPGVDHTRGLVGAPYTLVQYGGYECPECQRLYGTVRDLVEELGSEIYFAYRHGHPGHTRAAEAAETAHAQGEFWRMHDLLFTDNASFDERALFSRARDLGLGMERFGDEFRRHVYEARVQEHVDGARELSVISTPVFFVNGLRFTGPLTRAGLYEALADPGLTRELQEAGSVRQLTLSNGPVPAVG